MAGGYGEVGRRLAEDLAHDRSARLVIAGRDRARAVALAASLGDARAVRLDVNDRRSVEEALPGVGVVVSCADQSERLLLRAALRRGLAYTDVAPRLSSIRYVVGDDSVLSMHVAAQRTGARIVLGTGLVPGVSNVMARAAAASVGAVNEVETALLLGVGDAYGPSALEYLLQELTRPFVVTIDATERQVWPFTNARVVRFPRPFGRRRAYSFPFSDQFFYPHTLGAGSAIARLALDPAWLGAMVALLVRLGLPRRAQSPGARHRIHRAIARLRRLARKRDAYALVVEVQGTLGRLRGVLAGRNQAAATAAAAAATVRVLLEGEVVHPGAWLPEEVLEPDAFFSRLAAARLTVRFEGSAGRGMPHPRSTTSGGESDASEAPGGSWIEDWHASPASGRSPELSPKASSAEAAMSERTRGGQ